MKKNIDNRKKDLENKFIKDMVDNAYPLKNDVFMLFARRKDFCQEFLRVLLQDKKLVVVETEIQKNLPTIFSKYVVVDMLCRLGDKRIVNVEIQLTYEKEHAKRRYIS